MSNPADPQPQPPQPAPPEAPKSDTEKQYRALIEYFQWLVKITGGAAVIVLGLGAALTWKSLADAKKEAVEAAVAIAREEARKTVEAEFKASPVKQTIDEVAAREISGAVRAQISAQIAGVRTQLLEVGRIADIGMRIRIGLSVAPLEELKEIERNHADPVIRQFATQTRELITTDYDNSMARYWLSIRPEDRGMMVRGVLQLRSDDPISDKEILIKLFGLFREQQALGEKVNTTLYLRELSGSKYSVLDFEAVEKWAKEAGISAP